MSNVSVDNGNGLFKIITNESKLSYTNRLKRIDTEYENLFSSKKTNIYEYDNVKYTIDQNGISSGSRSIDRYKNKQYLIETLIGISQSTQSEKINLLLTVPADHYNDKTTTNYIKELFKKEHEIIVNGNKRKFDIEKVSVLPQSYLTVVDFILNDDLTITNNKHLASYLVVDIGTGTLDIVATKGLKIENMISENVGVKDFKTKYLNLIKKNEYVLRDKAKFTIKDIDDQPQNKITKYSKTYDFSKEYGIVSQMISNNVNNIINEYGIDYAEFDYIIYTGGTSLLIKDYLYMPNNAIIHENAVLSNSLGGLKYLNYKGGRNNG